MKNELFVILFCSFFVFIIGFFIFNENDLKLTGFVVEDGLSNVSEVLGATEEDILSGFEEVQLIISEMEKMNFSVNYFEDLILDANRVFEQAKYASMLRGEISATEIEMNEARKVLSLVDWNNIYYSDVLNYFDLARKRKIQAFFLYDSLSALKLSLNDYETQGIEVEDLKLLLETAENNFYEGRYENSNELVEDIKSELESKTLQSATLVVIQTNAKNFFARYWFYITAFVVFLAIISYLLYKKTKIVFLEKNIDKMRKEKIILFDLIKKTQEKRFKENKLSGLIYNLRMKNYKDRLSEIKETLPVLEKKLQNYKLFFK